MFGNRRRVRIRIRNSGAKARRCEATLPVVGKLGGPGHLIAIAAVQLIHIVGRQFLVDTEASHRFIQYKSSLPATGLSYSALQDRSSRAGEHGRLLNLQFQEKKILGNSCLQMLDGGSPHQRSGGLDKTVHRFGRSPLCLCGKIRVQTMYRDYRWDQEASSFLAEDMCTTYLTVLYSRELYLTDGTVTSAAALHSTIIIPICAFTCVRV